MQPEGSSGPGGEQQPERGVEEPEGKRAPNTGARLWGRVRSKLLRQKVLRVRGVAAGDTAELWGGSALRGDRGFLAGGFVGWGAVLFVWRVSAAGSVHGAGRLFGCFGSS